MSTTDLTKRIRDIERKAAESELLGNFSADEEVRTYNRRLAVELKEYARTLRARQLALGKNPLVPDRHLEFQIKRMSLLSDPRSRPSYHAALRGIEFSMASSNIDSVSIDVKVIITLQALARFSGTYDFDDLKVAYESFSKFRAKIEAAADHKFQNLQGNPSVFEGAPTLLIMSGDPSLEALFLQM